MTVRCSLLKQQNNLIIGNNWESKMKKIVLKKPIKREDKDDKKITELSVREPTAGDLRGIKLLDVMQMDTTAYAELIPRIVTPVITRCDFNQLSLADFTQLATAVAGFIEGDNGSES